MVGLRRLAHRAAYQVLRVWWFLARPHTQGVKLVLWSGDRVLFVRHTYGDRQAWELPGGGRRRRETAVDAARREAGEELGVDIADWAVVGEVVSREHATARLCCLRAVHDGSPLTLSRGELAEARWCAPADPPRPLGRHAAAVLALPGLVEEAP